METKKINDQETVEKQRKVNNVIIFNLPEAKTGDNDKDFKEDIAKLKSVFENKIVLQKEDVKAVFRIGVNTGNKPRPIIMKLSTNEKKLELIKLKDIKFKDEDQIVHNIYANPDRTKKEQELHKKLVAELKEKRASGNKNYAIRNGKVVQFDTPFRRDPQQLWG